jgi:hypothetical protein
MREDRGPVDSSADLGIGARLAFGCAWHFHAGAIGSVGGDSEGGVEAPSDEWS